jgi:hypothetical protein
MERLAWCVPALAMMGFGASFLVRPALWLTEFEENGTSGSAEPGGQTLRKIRLVGLAFIIAGLIWLYTILFAPPAAVDPVLF